MRYFYPHFCARLLSESRTLITLWETTWASNCCFVCPQTVRFRMAQLLDGAGKLSWVLLKSVTRFVFMFLNNCVAIPSYCLYLLLLQPLRIWDSSAFWHIEGVMFKWLLAMVSSWGWIAGYTGEALQLYGDGFACWPPRGRLGYLTAPKPVWAMCAYVPGVFCCKIEAHRLKSLAGDRWFNMK